MSSKGGPQGGFGGAPHPGPPGGPALPYVDGEAEAACSRLLVAFANAIDRNDYASVLDLFTEDALFARPGVIQRGQQEIAAFLQQRPAGRMTRHLCTNQEVRLLSADRAVGSAYVLFLQAGMEAGAALPMPMPPLSLVDYQAKFAWTGGEWRIESLRVHGVFQA